MNENLEIEYKMLVSEQEFNQLRDLTGVDQVLVQSNVYYDCTPSSTLKHIAMRIRDVQGKHWFTMKIPQAEGVREMEMELRKTVRKRWIIRKSGLYLTNWDSRCPFMSAVK